MKQIKACVFNVYGTLLDTYLPFLKYRDQLGENALGIYKLWRAKRLQYSSQLSLMDRYTDYEKIRKYALDFSCDVHGMNDEKIKDIFSRRIRSWTAIRIPKKPLQLSGRTRS